jgi:hypothetical protein
MPPSDHQGNVARKHHTGKIALPRMTAVNTNKIHHTSRSVDGALGSVKLLLEEERRPEKKTGSVAKNFKPIKMIALEHRIEGKTQKVHAFSQKRVLFPPI